ncbi:response regulator transcription factor [Chryseobacterium potabilaquae]|uniref:Oxygen regulatory protein NreC n=1 Tax=Chryseobacterium potabilaquae TaxID=2675057 RepID=A0A6N4X7J2_9FLAO|nr:response regulator transcription factor [Chryseobacterium potabilaquae]CAA7196687.1 Oxygen regulatory protein NreC [Chryseobacterium potabilaquae]
MNTRILIADAQHVSIEGMSFILKTMNPDIVIDRVYNKTQLMEKTMEKKYDFLILDIALLGNVFDSTVKNIKEITPKLKVIIFTAFPKEDILLLYLYQGVQGLVYKSYDESELRTALYSIFKHGYYYPQELLYNFIHTGKIPSYSSRGLDILSDREREVYFYLVKGTGLLEISNALGLHQSTVSIYKKNIFQKLNFNSLVDLINYDKYRENLS